MAIGLKALPLEPLLDRLREMGEKYDLKEWEMNQGFVDMTSAFDQYVQSVPSGVVEIRLTMVKRK